MENYSCQKIKRKKSSVFQRNYFPFTGNPDQPISTTRVPVPYRAGHYKVKMIGTNKEGKTFTMTDHAMIDMTGPTFTTDLEEGVIEYKPGTTSYPIKGSVIDKSFEEYKKQGIDINHSGYFVMEKNNGPMFTNGFYVNAEGKFAYDIPINPSAKSVSVELQAYNLAKLGTEHKNFTFVPEGSPYVSGSLENKMVKASDQVKLTLTANNVTEANKLATSFTFNKDAIEVVSVNAHSALESFGGAEITSELVPSGSSTKLNVSVDVPNGKITGDIPFAEVILIVKDVYNLWVPFRNSTASYTNEKNKIMSIVSAIAPIWVVPTYSKISGTLSAPQPFRKVNTTSWNPTIDASQIGAVLTVKDHEGNKVDASISLSRYAQIVAEKLPLTLEEMELSVDIPGHFTIYKPFHVGYTDDEGKIVGNWNSEVYVGAATSGDANKDDVIDVLDAIYLEQHWGTGERSADINFDKIVDANDMKYIQEHYLKKNPTAISTPEPKESFEGNTLNDILTRLGLN